jgi:hypothetical protein
MYVWTGPWARTRDPTPLLRRLTGEFADRIAAVWPAPHGPFLIAATARRHLACLALSIDEGIPPALEAAIDLPLKRAIRELLPSGPDGLPRILERLGEDAWTAEAYRRLLTLLAEPVRAKFLYHAEAITPGEVEGLAGIPLPVLRAGAGSLKLNRMQSDLLAEAYRVIEQRSGAGAAASAAARWGASATLKQLFEKASEDVIADLPPPPFAGGPTLRPLASKAAMREAAAKFRNCLASDRMAWAAGGDYAYFEWTGGAGAVVEITRDAVYGWRLNEARSRSNASIGQADRPALTAALAAMGVHVGRTHWGLVSALQCAVRPDYRPDAPEVAALELFGD